MATYEITAEMNLKKIIAESREVTQALNEFADNLEKIEKKYADSQENEETGFGYGSMQELWKRI